jgi:sorbitol/mannitol transport system permease protein
MAVATVGAKAPRGGSPLKRRHTWIWGFAAWAIGLIFVAPVLWMALTSLHTESDAATNPPSVAAKLTLSGYREFFDSNPWPALINSATAAIVSTLLVLALATPAAYALSVKPVKKWTDVMFFFLSTKFLPVVAALLPVYLIAKNLNLLDNIVTLVVLYAAMNLPIAVWMMRSFLAEIPKEIMEAAELDGARLPTLMRRIILPVTAPGLAATSLICFIFAWNELMFARVLTSTVAGTSPVFLTGFITSEGLFLAKLCAAALIVSLPVLIAGFAAQDKLVQGLSMGAVK